MFNIFFGDMIEYFLVILGGVEQNDRYQNYCNLGYDVKCQLVGSCILYCQICVYYGVGWYHKWEYCDIGCQDDVGQCQGGEYKCLCGFIYMCSQDGQQWQNYIQCRNSLQNWCVVEVNQLCVSFMNYFFIQWVRGCVMVYCRFYDIIINIVYYLYVSQCEIDQCHQCSYLSCCMGMQVQFVYGMYLQIGCVLSNDYFYVYYVCQQVEWVK